jgi:hypothetical protein
MSTTEASKTLTPEQVKATLAAAHGAQVRNVAEKIRCTREAKRLVDIEDRGSLAPAEVITLRALLAEPDIEEAWTVVDLQPRNTRVMIAAQYKTGKTTIVANLIRGLLDGDLFLGKYAVRRENPTVNHRGRQPKE